MRMYKSHLWSVIMICGLALLLNSCGSESVSKEVDVDAIEEEVSEEFKAVEEESEAIEEEMKNLENEVEDLIEEL